MGQDLAHWHVGPCQTAHYIPNYLTELEEQRLLTDIHASRAKWVQLSGRRLQNHGGVVHAKGLISAPLPHWLQQLVQRLAQSTGMFAAESPPNHVLINAYKPGEGILVCLLFYPKRAT